MSAHNKLKTHTEAAHDLGDPGNAGALPRSRTGIVNIVTAGAETRTLDDPPKSGIELTLNFQTDGGDCTITVASSIGLVTRTTIVLTTAGQFIRLVSRKFGAGFRWAIVSEQGGGAALTAQLTTITPADAVGTPDYAIAAVINTNAYGFVAAAEAITVLYVIQNLQVRVAELEARLEAAGIVVAN